MVDDAWDGTGAEEMFLALDAGYGKHPHTPSFVGSRMVGQHGNASLIISVGLPFTYEVAAWFMGIVSADGRAGGARLVMMGFATRSELAGVLTVACDSLLASSGVSDITDDITCSGGTPLPAGKRYYVLSFRAGVGSGRVAKACSGMVH